jgi:hypothetical protein
VLPDMILHAVNPIRGHGMAIALDHNRNTPFCLDFESPPPAGGVIGGGVIAGGFIGGGVINRGVIVSER